MTQGYAPPPYAQPPGGKTASPLGIASLVIGIIAVLFSWVPFCGMAAVPVAAIGLILGIVGLIIAVSGGKNGKGMPIGGIILCVAAVGIQIAVTGGLMMLGNRAQRQLQLQAQAAAAQVAVSGTTLPSNPGYTISNDPTADDIDVVLTVELIKAKALNRKPFVEFYADWCGPCRAITKALDDGNPLMVDAFAGTYIIRLNSDKWGNHLAGTGMQTNMIPVFYELGDDGKTTGRHIDGSAWEANTPANMAPPLKKFFRGE